MSKTESTDTQTTPTSLPMVSGESWSHGGKQITTQQSSIDRVSSPMTSSSGGVIDQQQGEHDSDEYRLPMVMENLKLSSNDNPPPVTTPLPDEPKPSGQSQHMVDELHARIQHLEAELEVSRRIPDRHHMVDSGPPPPQPHYQSSMPNYYHTSPHHSGEIIRGGNFNTTPMPPPPQQYPQTQGASLPVDTGFYHPCEYLCMSQNWFFHHVLKHYFLFSVWSSWTYTRSSLEWSYDGITPYHTPKYPATHDHSCPASTSTPPTQHHTPTDPPTTTYDNTGTVYNHR